MSFMDIDGNAIEVVRGSYPFKERENGVARHSLRYILGDLGDIKQKYFILGFHLNEFAEYEYYKDFGYESMKEFCLANIPLEYTAISRCMSVHKHTCERVEGKEWKKTNRMQEKYKQYGYSQLVEMLGMNEDQEKKCTPGMTVKEIREIKKQTKKKNNQENKNSNCDVATTENGNDNVKETITEISEQKKCKQVISGPSVFSKEMAIKSFMSSPANVVLRMFRERFGNDLKAEPRGKMLEMEIPGYKVTIRISFKEIEETEEK